jgi:hypothetical protein
MPHDKWVPVTTELRVLRLQMEEQSIIWRVAVNILNKQSQTADERWSCGLGFEGGADNSSP